MGEKRAGVSFPVRCVLLQERVIAACAARSRCRRRGGAPPHSRVRAVRSQCGVPNRLPFAGLLQPLSALLALSALLTWPTLRAGCDLPLPKGRACRRRDRPAPRPARTWCRPAVRRGAQAADAATIARTGESAAPLFPPRPCSPSSNQRRPPPGGAAARRGLY